MKSIRRNISTAENQTGESKNLRTQIWGLRPVNVFCMCVFQ